MPSKPSFAPPVTTMDLRNRFESLIKSTAPQLFIYWQELEASIDKDTNALKAQLGLAQAHAAKLQDNAKPQGESAQPVV